MTRKIKFNLFFIFFAYTVLVSAESFIIGESTSVQDRFLRNHISSILIKNPDHSVLLEKMSCETALNKLQNNEIDFFTTGNISSLPENCKVTKYNSIYLGVIVNKENPLKEINLTDLKKIFNNQEKNWSFLIAENNYSIHKFGPQNENSAIYVIADKLFPRKKFGDNSLYFPIDNVEIMVESNKNSIGLVELKQDNNYLKRVKLLPIIKDNGEQNSTQLDFYIVFKPENSKKIEEFLKNE